MNLMYVLGIPITGTEISPSAFILDSFLVFIPFERSDPSEILLPSVVLIFFRQSLYSGKLMSVLEVRELF